MGSIERKVYSGEVMSFDDKTLTLEHFISTETQDSGGDIMLADGMKERGSVVVLFQHGLDPVYGNEPIAKPLGVRVGLNKQGKKGLIARTQYFDGSQLTPPDNTGEKLYQKDKQGFMPNWSIGFEIVKSEPVSGGGRRVSEWLLHEYSKVAIGMNSEATSDFGVKLLPGPEEQALLLKASLTSSKRIQRQALGILHRAAITELQKGAEGEDFHEMTADKLAKSVLADFSESALDHVTKYIKAVAEDESAEEEEVEAEESEEEEKTLSDVSHKAAHRALKIALKEMIGDINAFKSKKETDADVEAKKIVEEHEKVSVPHASKYAKAWNARKQAGKKFFLSTEHKSIAGRTSWRICCDSMRTIFEAIYWEICDRAWSEDVPTETVVEETLTEAHALLAPYAGWIVDDIRASRAEANGANTDALTEAKNMFNLRAEKAAGDPAPATLSTPIIKENDPLQAIVHIKTPEAPPMVKIISTSAPVAPNIKVLAEVSKEAVVKISGAELNALADRLRKSLDDSFNAELSKQKGKVS